MGTSIVGLKIHVDVDVDVEVAGEGWRPGIGGGFDSSHHPVVGTFDRFNGLSGNIFY